AQLQAARAGEHEHALDLAVAIAVDAQGAAAQRLAAAAGDEEAEVGAAQRFDVDEVVALDGVERGAVAVQLADELDDLGLARRLGVVGAVAAVGAGRRHQLHAPHDLPLEARAQQDDLAATDGADDSFPVAARLLGGQRLHEADRGAALDDVDEQGAQIIEGGG